MKTQTLKRIAAIIVPSALFLGLLAPALADNVSTDLNLNATVSAGGSVKADATARAAANAATKEQNGIDRGTTEITNRINDLTALLGRINGMVHVSDTAKANLTTSINATISSLTTLKAKIATDSAADLKLDLKSITGAYRVYMLVVPQSRILAAGDRANTVADMMTALSVKLQTRITAAQTAGKDVSAMTAMQADITAKVADAKIQGQAAITAVASLTPDNGDTAKMQANDASIKQARADIQAAQKDLQAAQKDVKSILQALKGLNLNASAGSAASVQ